MQQYMPKVAVYICCLRPSPGLHQKGRGQSSCSWSAWHFFFQRKSGWFLFIQWSMLAWPCSSLSFLVASTQISPFPCNHHDTSWTRRTERRQRHSCIRCAMQSYVQKKLQVATSQTVNVYLLAENFRSSASMVNCSFSYSTTNISRNS